MIPVFGSILKPSIWYKKYGASATFDSGKAGTGIVLSAGNLQADCNQSGWTSVLATTAAPTGKSYCEMKITKSGFQDAMYGCADTNFIRSSYLGSTSNACGSQIDANSFLASGITVDYTPNGSLALNDVIGLFFDNTNHRLYISKNGVFYNSGSPKTNSGWVAHVLPSTVYAALSLSTTAITVVANFGGSAFAYAPT